VVVPHVEGGVRAHELHRRAYRLADGPRFGAQVVFEAPYQPQAWLVLKHHQSEAVRCH
jgi:hypothetical protein